MEFDVLNTKFNSAKSILTSERDNLLQKNERLKTERNTAITQISSDNLREYERLATSKQGIAIGRIIENSCSVCGTTFTPAQCQSAKSQSAFFYCPTCHRIIYGD
jgi:predicted  nucleic acid-binding Zn-ribbon protein